MFLAVVVCLLLLSAGMAAVVGAVYLWLVWYVSLHERRRRRQLGDNNVQLPKQQGLSKADLQRLPTVECRKDGGERTPGCGGEGECAVCLEPFLIGDWCRLIPACSHAFHVHCADAWLSKSSVCPICRRSAACESLEKNGPNGGAACESLEKNGANGGAAAALQEEEARNEESGWRAPPPLAESVVVDMAITITPAECQG